MKHFELLLAVVAILRLGAQLNAEEPAKITEARATRLKANAASFVLDLNFIREKVGAERYSLTLSVPPLAVQTNDPFSLHAQISEEQAIKIIDKLAADGFLGGALDVTHGQDASREIVGPSYLLTVSAPSKTERFILRGELGWGPKMLAQLDGLSSALNGEAFERTQKLLGGLFSERKEWKKAAGK